MTSEVPPVEGSQSQDAQLETRARAGKSVFIVRVVNEKRYRVWAEDAQKAEDAVYWRRSSGRPFPAIQDLGDQPQRFIVEVAPGGSQAKGSE